MSGALSAVTGGGGLAAPTGGALATPDGAGAAGRTAISLTRQYLLLDKAWQALNILLDIGTDLRQEVTVTEDMANYLTASYGERISLEQLRVLAGMFIQIAEGSLGLVLNGRDAVQAAQAANLQVRVIQEQLHGTGADGAYVDSQRRAG